MRLHISLRAATLVAAASFLTAPGAGTAKAACANPDALGVSRTIEIDTSEGPLFGSVQYKEKQFLRDKEIVLTFDDGPNRVYTKPVIDALGEHCTKATFFMVGRMAVNDPALVREIAARGHTVGSHTWSHKNLGNLSRRSGRKQIELGISAISKALGKPIAPFFRFPYLSDPNRMINHVQGRGIGIFSIDIDSKDYRTRNGGPVARKVMRDLERRGRGIILFHDIQRSTAKAIPQLLRWFKAKGYKVVHLVPRSRGTTRADMDGLVDQYMQDKTIKLASEPGAFRPSATGADDIRRRNTRQRARKSATANPRPAKVAKRRFDPEAFWREN